MLTFEHLHAICSMTAMQWVPAGLATPLASFLFESYSMLTFEYMHVALSEHLLLPC